MNDALPRLAAALSDRYRIERELGQGGMATVYLAHDLKHDRKVAIKVLKPELAASLAHDRFLREITTTASLRHPHILPLFDSGATDDLVYYVMPWVDGESLRDRLERDKQLPLDDTLRIAAEVADALSYAHGRGVIHRDIKPENILLEGGHAVVADFGIARAVASAGPASLTQAGMAIGTPAYMSPEQAAGERDLDGRSDLYALACVTYEMLAGQPPFTGPTVESIIHQQLGALPRPVTELRPAIPATVASALQRALAKSAADRHATPSAFSAALRTESQPSAQRCPRWAPAAAVVVLLAVAGWFGLHGARSGPPLDPDVIAVLPFRVGGDQRLNYLRESMLDLLQARLSAGSGPRIVEPRTLLAAWRREVGNADEDLSEEASRSLARGLGAGRVLLGSAIATPTEFTLSGTLLGVEDGARLAHESITGDPDSIATLVNRLTAALLIQEAGETSDRGAGLAAAPLDALQDYLAGQKAYRRGEYFEAMELYGKALARDSNFVEAGFRMVITNAWIGTVGTVEGYRVLPQVWRMRDRLSARDRGLLLAIPLVGPNFPDPSTYREIIAQAERAANAAPDSPDHWLLLGQLLTYYGAVASEPEWGGRADAALDRAITLDSSFSSATATRLFAALRTGDREATERYSSLLARQVERGAADHPWLWAAARTLGDSVGARKWLEVNARIHRSQIFTIVVLHSAAFALPLEDAHWAVTTLQREATTDKERLGAELGDLALRFAEGRSTIPNTTLDQQSGAGWTETVVQQALIEPAYRGMAQEALRAVQARGVSSPGLYDCYGTLLSEVNGDWTSTGAAIQRLANAGATQEVCRALLLALQEEHLATGPARPALDDLDSLMFGGPRSSYGVTSPDLPPVAFANLTIARLREAQGAHTAALAAIRRREVDYFPAYLWSLPAFLRVEGRLAAHTGDTAGAIRAYDAYLTLRTDPDPPFRAQRDSVLAERSALTRTTTP